MHVLHKTQKISARSSNVSAFRLKGSTACSSHVSRHAVSDIRHLTWKERHRRRCQSYRVHRLTLGNVRVEGQRNLTLEGMVNRALHYHVGNGAVRIDMCLVIKPPTASPRTGTNVLRVSTGTHWCVLMSSMTERQLVPVRRFAVVVVEWFCRVHLPSSSHRSQNLASVCHYA